MKLAFIDLDLTVLVNPFWPAVFPHFARDVAARSPARPTEQQVIDDLIARSEALSRRQDVNANDWDRLTRECAVGFGAVWTEPVAALVERYLPVTTEVAGAAEMLSALRGAGWTCVATSAGYRRYQIPPLRHLGLLDHFDRLMFADEVRSLKRRRAFYGQIPPAATHVAAVGDMYVDDCLYPTWFGFTAIWFTGVHRTGELDCGIEPYAEVTRLDRIPDTLAEVASRDALRYHPPTGSTCPACGGPGSGAGLCALCRCTAHAPRQGPDTRRSTGRQPPR